MALTHDLPVTVRTRSAAPEVTAPAAEPLAAPAERLATWADVQADLASMRRDLRWARIALRVQIALLVIAAVVAALVGV